MKKTLILSLALVSSFSLLTPANAASSGSTTTNKSDTMTSLFGDPVIVQGKGVNIKRSDLDQIMTGMKAAAAARGQTIQPAQANLIEGQMLNRLIQIQLLTQKATAADRAEGKKKSDEQLALLKERLGTPEALDRQLKAVGITQDELQAKATQEATAMAALQRELGVTITDAEAKKFYDDHPADFEQPELVHVRHILLTTIDPTTRAPLPAEQQQAKRKKIDEILKRARAGENFGTLATEFSEDPGSKDNGGELPPFGRGQMVPEFETTAFTLKTNQISDVVTTAYGYHIIQLLDKTPAKKAEYSTVADRIKDYLAQQQVEKLAPDYLEKLKKAADVKILDPSLEAEVSALTNLPPRSVESAE